MIIFVECEMGDTAYQFCRMGRQKQNFFTGFKQRIGKYFCLVKRVNHRSKLCEKTVFRIGVLFVLRRENIFSTGQIAIIYKY